MTPESLVDSTTAGYDMIFISPSFFGYANEIESALAARGRRVRRFEDRPALDVVTKILTRIDPVLVARSMAAYFATILQVARDNPIRDVLMIKGEALSLEMIRQLRSALPHARFSLYFWDSFRNMPRGTAEKVRLFDRALTFDLEDAARDTTLRYRPLFYLPQFSQLPDAVQDIDMLFIGTIHTDRFRVLQRLKRAVPPGRNVQFVMYFHSRRLLAIQSLINPRYLGAKAEEFIFRPLSPEQVTALVARCKISVDIERAVQTGLTMRTIEMLGSGRKVLTTNRQILKADFYSPRNIAVIDRRNPVIPEGFLDTDFEPVPNEVLARYTLSSWLDEVVPD